MPHCRAVCALVYVINSKIQMVKKQVGLLFGCLVVGNVLFVDASAVAGSVE